jgi:hypothetical protein
MRIRIYKLEDGYVAVRYDDEEQFAGNSEHILSFPNLEPVLVVGRELYGYDQCSAERFDELELVKEFEV